MPRRHLRLSAKSCIVSLSLVLPLHAASTAHERSRFASAVDPTYSATSPRPSVGIPSNGIPWLYGDGELEAHLLKVLRAKSAAACTNVGYPGFYYEPAATMLFRREVDRLAPTLRFRTTGTCKVTVNGSEILPAADATAGWLLTMPIALAGQRSIIGFKVATDGSEPPALWVDAGPDATEAVWQCSVDGRNWTTAQAIPAEADGAPPHRSELPTVELRPVGSVGELFDFGRTLFGHVSFRAAGTPVLRVGESTPEALANDLAGREQREDLVPGPNGTWRSQFPLAFRYVRVTGAQPEDVRVTASFRSVAYRGAFACADERLTRLWMTSAFTLRSCMNLLLFDGLKRDRLPWAGDQAMNLIVNAYTFADTEIFRRSFTALGRNGIEASDINGIVDYSLWWVINHDQFQRYFDDPVYLAREWPRIQALLAHMEMRCDERGLLEPRPNTWLFIDWGLKKEDKRILVPLQVLWFWALKAGSSLAERAHHPTDAARWAGHAGRIQKVLHREAWNPALSGWQLYFEKEGQLSRHANLLAVLSALASPEQHDPIRQHLLGHALPPVITPFMASLEMTAIARLGAADALSGLIERYWGPQVDHGATTFWEKYDPAEPDALYSMYDRPFANSLCHAWGSGAAALLPAHIVGLRPETDGWRRFTVEPALGQLAWAAATVPTSRGDIMAEVRQTAGVQTILLTVPPGATANVQLPATARILIDDLPLSTNPDARVGVRTVSRQSFEVDAGQWRIQAMPPTPPRS